jgi:single-strand DNA-binding protein
MIHKHQKTKKMNALRNKVQLIGHLGHNPEIKTFDDNKKLARFSIATDEIYHNSKGERVKETQWHNVIAWGKTAENVEKYLVKGKEVAVEGKLVTKSYTDKEGVKKFSTEVVVSDMLLLGSKD